MSAEREPTSADERGEAAPQGGVPQRQEVVGTLTRLSDGRDFALGFGSLRVGREKRAELAIDDSTLSRHHADICYESGRYVVYDHSGNGTWINGKAVATAQPLSDSDVVRFGETEFRFSLEVMDPSRLVSTLRLDGESEPARATQDLREVKRRRRRRAALLVATLLILSLVAVVGLAIYFLFPGLAGRMIHAASGG